MREYLVKLREHRGLTQVEAAKRLLISQSYLATLKAFAKLYKSPLELLVAKESQYIDAQR